MKKAKPKFKDLSKGQKAAVGFTSYALAQWAVMCIWAVYREVKAATKNK